jgi:hypothetical protein
MRNEGLTKSFLADGAIAKYRFVKFGSDDDHVDQADARNVLLMGVNASLAATDAEDPVDIVVEGIATVEYGGSVTRGNPLTSNADGKAIAATDRVYTAVIAGGSAGALTVTGILTTDTLVSVVQANIVADTGDNATGNKVNDVVNLTSEFTITATNEIDNTAGTATTGDKLIVTYQRKDSILGVAMISGVSGDHGAILLK